MRRLLGFLLLVGCTPETSTMHERFEVRETIERFHDAVNRRRPADIAALFVEGGVWEVAPPFEFRFEGKTAIEAGITGTIGATELLVQSCGPVVVDLVDATHAKARTSMQEFGRFNDGTSMHVAGTYHDALERQADGGWRFVHRRFVAHYADDVPVTGKALLPSDGAKSDGAKSDGAKSDGAKSGAPPMPSVARPGPSERQAVSDVVARFASTINAGDVASAAQLFAEDAVWASAAGELGFRKDGRAAIQSFLVESSAAVEALYYLVGTPNVTLLDNGRARSELPMLEVLHIKATNERRLLFGTYVDELAKLDGAWRFKTRHVTIRHAETLRGASPP